MSILQRRRPNSLRSSPRRRFDAPFWVQGVPMGQTWPEGSARKERHEAHHFPPPSRFGAGASFDPPPALESGAVISSTCWTDPPASPALSIRLNSTRRFFERPAGVLFVATGRSNPKPLGRSRLASMPLEIRYATTDFARAPERRRLYSRPPRLSVCPSTWTGPTSGLLTRTLATWSSILKE